jgi:flagellar export protein FliJ
VKGIAGLIRLGRWRLDGERKRLAALEAQAAGYAGEIRRLEHELESESALANQSVEAGMSYSRYLSSNLAARRNLARSIAELEPQIEVVRKAIEAAFREVKAYELVAENRRRAELKAERRKEQSRLDEIGAIRHRRQGEAPDAIPTGPDPVVSGDEGVDRVADGLGGEGVDEARPRREGDAPVETDNAAAVVEDGAHAVAVSRGEGGAGANDQLETVLEHEPVELQRPEAAGLECDEEPPGGGA